MSDLFVKRAASISECGTYRWTLQRRWAAGERVCWIMLNPSTADAERDDPTVLRCMAFSRSWGYGGLIVVNLYPFRSSKPAECRRWAEWDQNGPDYYARDALHRNKDVVALAAKRSALVVAAWGAGNWDDMWSQQVAEAVSGGEQPWSSIFCLGLTADGSPKHPLARGVHRVPYEQKPKGDQ